MSRSRLPADLGLALLVIAVFASSSLCLADDSSFLNRFNTVNTVASTLPASGLGMGDQNPYGTAVVKKSVGSLQKGNVLVSNFNNNGPSGGEQGTGKTIMQISPDGTAKLFATIDPSDPKVSQCTGGIGLTTALVVLHRGWVIVGSLPTSDGTSATAMAGCLIVLDSAGNVAETFQGNGINGPWDMTAKDEDSHAWLFVTNVLNGDVTTGPPHIVNQGTVLRIELDVPRKGEGPPVRMNTTTIGSGFPETADPAALVIGPTGVGLAHDGTLYVADSHDNRIAAIPDAIHRTDSAGTGDDVSVNGALNDPLGLAISPDGHIITANGDDGLLVETTPKGQQVATFDTTFGGGALFGVAIVPGGRGLYFVDDGDNSLKVFFASH